MIALFLRRAGGALAIAVACFLSSAQMTPAAVGTSAEAPLVIRQDRGGRLKDYLSQLEDLKATGRQVQIIGKCQSSCTVFLGAPNVCVSPSARLGFHGPRYRTSQISEERHLFWSQKMAEFYPREVAAWYMRDARHVVDGVKVLKGENLIRLGIPRC